MPHVRVTLESPSEHIAALPRRLRELLHTGTVAVVWFEVPSGNSLSPQWGSLDSDAPAGPVPNQDLQPRPARRVPKPSHPGPVRKEKLV